VPSLHVYLRRRISPLREIGVHNGGSRAAPAARERERERLRVGERERERERALFEVPVPALSSLPRHPVRRHNLVTTRLDREKEKWTAGTRFEEQRHSFTLTDSATT